MSLHVILDGADYHKSALFKAQAEALNITLHSLPSYSSNSKPIERLWKVMNREVRINCFFSSEKEFNVRIRPFFNTCLPKIAEEPDSWINNNFQLLELLHELFER
jgi:transposase